MINLEQIKSQKSIKELLESVPGKYQVAGKASRTLTKLVREIT